MSNQDAICAELMKFQPSDYAITQAHPKWLFSFSTAEEPETLVALDQNGDFFIRAENKLVNVTDGEAVMAAFKRVTDAVPDDRLASFPEGDDHFIPLVATNSKGETVWVVHSDGTFTWRDRPMGKDLRIAKALVSLCLHLVWP